MARSAIPGYHHALSMLTILPPDAVAVSSRSLLNPREVPV